MDPFTELLTDIERNQSEASDLAALGLPDGAVAHIRDTIWEFMKGAFERVRDTFVEHGKAIAELIEEDGEMLQEETATKLIETLALGGKFALQLKTMIEKSKDQSAAAKKWLGMIDTYAKATAELVPLIKDITIEEEVEEDASVGLPDPDGEEDDDEEEDEDGEGDEDDDEDDEDDEEGDDE